MKRLTTAARVGRMLPTHVGQEPYPGYIQSEGALPPPGSPNAVSPPNGLNYACPYPEKLASDSISLLTTASGTLEITTPGLFCPNELTLFASVDLTDVRVTQIRVGLENQVISGSLSGEIFGNAQCCALACLKCLCSPSIPLEIDVTNLDAMTQVITAVVKGTYVDACENPPVDAMYKLPEGCRPNEKFLGFDVTIPAGGTITVPVQTPGRFCPRLMFITGPDVATVSLAQVNNGLESELLGPIPAQYFEIRECGCRVLCFKCICAPGVVENFTFTGGAGDIIHVDLVGEYTKVC
jgi:hypothetical protein